MAKEYLSGPPEPASPLDNPNLGEEPGGISFGRGKDPLPPDAARVSIQDCISLCLECERSCREMVTHTLESGIATRYIGYVRLLESCAEICATNARFMLMGSEFHARTSEVCAEVCDKCAEECDRIDGDAKLHACAQVCRHCSDSCRKLVRSSRPARQPAA